ncbi:MAG: CHAT domain-containing protein [Saprospirales bacterium]|nr:CHAT domain-containing protein [Saprospirales bacterium]
MTQHPVVLLTFSNNMDAYLPQIAAEQAGIKKALLDHSDKNYLQLRDVQHASTEDVFYLLNRYHNRICILHYGGHADGQNIQLEKEIGVVQKANVKGIAGLLGTQQNLKLVFLNGCATAGQVRNLLDNGIPAVIATSVKIDDQQAREFAVQFYEAMATGSDIATAFTKAKAFLESQSTSPEFLAIESSRGFELRAEKGTDKLPWGLYFKPETEEALKWKLPTESALELRFDSDAFSGKNKLAINSHLVDTTLKAIRESIHVKELARKIHQARNAGDANRKPSDAEKKDVIVRSFPAPISAHLRTLFSAELSEKMDQERLQQLATTYQKSLKLLAFILLSDLWDATQKRQKALELAEIERRQIEAFFDLGEAMAPHFDYFQLIDALLRIAQKNESQIYLDPLNAYPNGWAEVPVFREANDHFELIRTALEEDVSGRLIEPYCIASEQQLAAFLSELHFLIDYKMAVIKNIEVYQVKNMPPRTFKHVMVELDNNYNDVGRKDRQQELPEPTDIESVLLYRDQLSENLNLSPFILDENALTKEFNSKIYYFGHRTENGLRYFWIENEKDTLDISGQQFGYVLQQFEKARKDILNEQPTTTTSLLSSNENDILTLM